MAEVDVVDLDSFAELNLKPESNVAVLKIDVEGMESEVLRGAERLLRKHRPVVGFEQHESDFPVEGNSEALDYLISLNYRLVHIEQKPKTDNVLMKRLRNLYELPFGRKEQFFLTHTAVVPKRFHGMIYAIPEERFPEIKDLF